MQGKITCLYGWCEGNVNNGYQNVYEDICNAGLLGGCDQNLQSRTHLCKANLKPRKLFRKILQDYSGLFLSSALHIVSRLTALNLRGAGATLETRWMADVEMWPEAQTSTALRDGEKR